MLTQVPYSKPSSQRNSEDSLVLNHHRTLGSYNRVSDVEYFLKSNSTSMGMRNIYAAHYVPIVEEVENKEIELTWVISFLQSANKSLSSDEIKSVSMGFIELNRRGEYPLIESLLNIFVTQDSSLETIVTCLRVNFSIKHKLAKWGDLVRVGSERVKALGRNPDTLLKGLA